MRISFSAVLLSLHILIFCTNVKCYSQISTYGSGIKAEGPRIFKAINADLLFPETFNSTNNVISTTQSTLVSATTPSLSNNRVHYREDSVNDMTIAATPLVYVTPATQTSLQPQMLNEQTMESNQMRSDYPKQAFESPQASDNHQQQRLQLQQQQQQQFTSTGRAVDYRPAYQLDQFMNAARPLPYAIRTTNSYLHKGQTSPYNGAKVLPYSQNNYQFQRPLQLLRRPPSQAEVYKLNGKAELSDRFTPGEAVASSLFTHNKHKHNHNHHHGNKVAASSNFVKSYTSPKDLYAFPPNINAKYPKPSEDAKAALASININSYVPPPAGPLKSQVNYPLVSSASNNEGYKYSEPTSPNEGYKYNGPVNPEYLPPNGIKNEKPQGEMKPNVDGSNDTEGDDGDNAIGVLPASAMGNGDDDKTVNGGDDMKDMEDMGTMPMGDADHNHDHDHDHDHIHDHLPMAYDTGKEYPTPPPGWMEEHHPPDHGSSFSHFSHNYPEIIYDDHHHDFHHDHHHIEPPATTVPPPPEPLPSEQPQEPRVKKYSYFYIGRKLWYIPLYFTVWFSFYVLWLILKSIARHKVNLPNHYVSRRSLPSFTDENAKEFINRLTISVLQQIDNFQHTYIT